ncbi:MAG TPA: FdrA family protein [Nocardioidaceae bacterium]|nr:FdrA family protein [Nocardioidaceae bacterium]
MSTQHVEVRRGQYHDSVTLLSVSRTVAAVDGIEAAQVAMATPLNLDVLEGMGFELPALAPDDLVIALRFEAGLDQAGVDTARSAALAAMEAALTRRDEPGEAQQEPARTTGLALERKEAPLVVVSTPGASAGAEAWDALQAGSSVMLFSDNVSLDTEIALKQEAARRGLLVMGPDCGTAVVGGVGLGFANVVRPGPVSLVAASGTGAQQLLALLDAAGVGVRHCLGLGGRDLSANVGGLAAEQALRTLAKDEGTELVVLVSKPADSGVVSKLEELAASLGLAVEWAVLGPDSPDLTQAAERVCERLGVQTPVWPTWPPAAPSGGTSTPSGDHEIPVQRAGADQSLLRGLFAGGTLCDEAMALAAAELGPVASNIPLDESWPRLDASGPSALKGALATAGHAFVDLGDDTMTVGRAHPMIDPSLRLEAIEEAAQDARVRVILLDVVLGHGAHDDPAGVHAPVIRAAIDRAAADGRTLDVVVSLTATAGDPQSRDASAETLAKAGAAVHLSNAEATRAAVALIRGESR